MFGMTYQPKVVRHQAAFASPLVDKGLRVESKIWLVYVALCFNARLHALSSAVGGRVKGQF